MDDAVATHSPEPELIVDPLIRSQPAIQEPTPTGMKELEALLDEIRATDIDSESRDALLIVAYEMTFWPHVAQPLVPWALREFARGRAQAWFRDHGLETSTASYLLGRIASLFVELDERGELRGTGRRSKPGGMTWPQLVTWIQSRARQLETEEAEKWERREIVDRLSNGWTIERVSEHADLLREGRLMGNCLQNRPDCIKHGCELFSLRDERARPHVDFEVMGGRTITRVEGRFNMAPKPGLSRNVVRVRRSQSRV